MKSCRGLGPGDVKPAIRNGTPPSPTSKPDTTRRGVPHGGADSTKRDEKSRIKRFDSEQRASGRPGKNYVCIFTDSCRDHFVIILTNFIGPS